MDRAERRRRERGARKQPVIIAGEGVVAGELGHQFEAKPHAQLPTKKRGEHRWIASAAYVLSQDMAEKAEDPDTLKLLDHENLMFLGIGCWDCEQPLGVVKPGSWCPAKGAD